MLNIIQQLIGKTEPLTSENINIAYHKLYNTFQQTLQAYDKIYTFSSQCIDTFENKARLEKEIYKPLYQLLEEHNYEENKTREENKHLFVHKDIQLPALFNARAEQNYPLIFKNQRHPIITLNAEQANEQIICISNTTQLSQFMQQFIHSPLQSASIVYFDQLHFSLLICHKNNENHISILSADSLIPHVKNYQKQAYTLDPKNVPPILDDLLSSNADFSPYRFSIVYLDYSIQGSASGCLPFVLQCLRNKHSIVDLFSEIEQNMKYLFSLKQEPLLNQITKDEYVKGKDTDKIDTTSSSYISIYVTKKLPLSWAKYPQSFYDVKEAYKQFDNSSFTKKQKEKFQRLVKQSLFQHAHKSVIKNHRLTRADIKLFISLFATQLDKTFSELDYKELAIFSQKYKEHKQKLRENYFPVSKFK